MKITLLAICLFLPSCGFLGTGADGRKGVSVQKAQQILITVHDNVAFYDMNKDGFITQDEVLPLTVALTNAIYIASQPVVSVPAPTSQPTHE